MMELRLCDHDMRIGQQGRQEYAVQIAAMVGHNHVRYGERRRPFPFHRERNAPSANEPAGGTMSQAPGSRLIVLQRDHQSRGHTDYAENTPRIQTVRYSSSSLQSAASKT